MPPRGYVLVFFCWALLTVITPTLISWSAAQANKNAGIVGGATTELKVNRRMMGSYPESSHVLKNRTLAMKPGQAPSPAPASALSPAPTPTSELAPAPQPASASVQLSVDQTIHPGQLESDSKLTGYSFRI